MFRTELRTCLAVAALTTALSAQSLRHGVWHADAVVTADVISVRPLGNDVILHKLRILSTLKGTAPAQVTIVEQKNVSDRPKPLLGPPRIYCLKVARRVSLPDRHGPFYRMAGFRGDHPLLGDDPKRKSAALRLVETLIASENGNSPLETCRALVNIALGGEGAARTEAVQTLRERDTLRERLDALQRSAMLTRAVGESDDIALKTALASLCAELRMPGVVNALCLSLETTAGVEFPRTVGRLAKFLHGEQAFETLRPHIVRARDAKVRAKLLLALGATETETALDALLRYKRVNGASEAIDAALRAHGTKRAMAAVATKRGK